MSIIIPVSGVNITASEFHDGHDSHWESNRALSGPCTSHAERAVRLYREAVAYPSTVRVFAPSMPIVGQMEGIL